MGLLYLRLPSQLAGRGLSLSFSLLMAASQCQAFPSKLVGLKQSSRPLKRRDGLSRKAALAALGDVESTASGSTSRASGAWPLLLCCPAEAEGVA